MAEQELPPVILKFRTLSNGIKEIKTVLAEVEAGRFADLSEVPEKVFGELNPNVEIDEELLKSFIDESFDEISAKCVDTFDAAVHSEIAAGALFAATRTHAETTGQTFVNNDRDAEQAAMRLSRLTVKTDEYQDEPWEDENAANALKTQIEGGLLAGFAYTLGANEKPFHVLRAETLEAVTDKALDAGIARLEAAKTLMAGELLRIRNHIDPSQAVLADDEHKVVLRNIGRNIAWAETMLLNADEASPAMRRRWGLDDEDGGKPSGPAKPRLN